MAYTSENPIFSVTVDVVCLTVRDGEFQVLLVERARPAVRGRAGVAGRFRQDRGGPRGRGPPRTSRRDEHRRAPFIDQLKTYGRPDRDPGGRTVSVAFLAVAPDMGDARGGSDAAAANWHPVAAFCGPDDRDHWRSTTTSILRDAVRRARGRLEHSPLATTFCPPEFTIADLRGVYEAIRACGSTRQTSTARSPMRTASSSSWPHRGRRPRATGELYR